MICKQCRKKSPSGHKFCNKKCRNAWKAIHNTPGMKKRAKKRQEDFIMWLAGGNTDHEGNSYPHG
jgi:hypothetical protein